MLAVEIRTNQVIHMLDPALRQLQTMIDLNKKVLNNIYECIQYTLTEMNVAVSSDFENKKTVYNDHKTAIQCCFVLIYIQYV